MEKTLFCALSLFFLNTLLHRGHAQDAQLTLEPKSSYFFTGELVTFICNMTGGDDADWLYKFSRNDQQLVSLTPKKSYSLKLTAELSGDYQCISNHRVSANMTKHSNKVTLSVSDHKPTASLSANSTAVGAAGGVTLSCWVAGSDGWTYDWFRRAPDSSEAQIGSGDGKKSFQVSAEGIYWCRGRRGSPAFLTKDSHVHRIEKTVANRISVTLQPKWTQIFPGEMVTLRCEIQGGGDTKWEYEWRTTSSNTPPAQSEYRINSASVSYSGTYWCKGRTNLFSSTEWSQFQLTVSANRPKPTVEAEKRTIAAGHNVTLSCAVKDSAEWKYSWFRSTSPSSEAQIMTDAEQGKDINIFKGGRYHCRGGRGNPVYVTKDSDAIDIEKQVSNEAVVTLQPNWPLIFIGESITVRCDIKDGGNTQWEYEWSKPSSDTVSAREYRIIRASVSDSGSYRCLGKHKDDVYSTTAWSHVVTLRVSAVRPAANLTADITVFPAGGSVTLSCSVNLPSSELKYFWYRGTKTSEPLTSKEATHISGQSVSVSQEGIYWCRGGRGSPVYYTEYSDSVSVQEIGTLRAVVTSNPKWPVIYEGETVALRCEIHGGHAEWEYEWETTSSEKPPHQDEYWIGSFSQSGVYWCKGRLKSSPQRSTGWSKAFTLTSDKPQPVLTVSPSWLSPGASVTLNCELEHPSAGWSFYWYKAVPQLLGTWRPHRFHYEYGMRHPKVYTYELLRDSQHGTQLNSYIIHGQTHTAGYVCRAGRGDPVYHTHHSQPTFVWSGDVHPSASLSVNPDTVQHFDSVSLSCEGNSSEWTMRGFPEDIYWGYYSRCHRTKARRNGITCRTTMLHSTAVYWCESGSGHFSNAVNITRAFFKTILVSPVHPVAEGVSVTLGCNSGMDTEFHTVAFYKNDKLIQSDGKELQISEVSKSDEGFYKCEIGGYQSQKSYMSVRSTSTSSSPVLWIVGLIIGIVVVVLLPLLLLCWYRRLKDSCWNSSSSSQRTNQTLAIDQPVSQDENQQQVYSSLLHRDLSVYETVNSCENFVNRNKDQPGESAEYHNVNQKNLRHQPLG